MLDRPPALGISIDNVIRQLEDEGAEKFIKPFDKLTVTVALKVSTAFDEAVMKVSPHAGNSADASMPVNVARLTIIHNTGVPGRR